MGWRPSGKNTPPGLTSSPTCARLRESMHFVRCKTLIACAWILLGSAAHSRPTQAAPGPRPDAWRPAFETLPSPLFAADAPGPVRHRPQLFEAELEPDLAKDLDPDRTEAPPVEASTRMEPWPEETAGACRLGVEDSAERGEPPFRVATADLPPGRVLRRALHRMGIRGPEFRRVLRGFGPRVFRQMRRGGRVLVALGANKRVSWIRFRPEPDTAWCGVRTPRGRYRVARLYLPVAPQLEVVEGIVRNRWTDATTAAGEHRTLGTMAEGLIPLRRARPLPRRFRMVVEKHYVGRTMRGYGPIELLEIVGPRGTHRVVRFPREGDPSAYFTESGRPVRPSRLRAPVLDAEVTSHYGRRRHPIRRRWQLHRGVDYGADTGAPVFAASDGHVRSFSYRSRFGRMVVLEHPAQLVTRYAHLRAFAPGLEEGQVVRAGDLIGFVGSSGLSTGPHLHFETIVRERVMNPLRYRPPAPAPLEAGEKAAFEQRVEHLLSLLRELVS